MARTRTSASRGEVDQRRRLGMRRGWSHIRVPRAGVRSAPAAMRSSPATCEQGRARGPGARRATRGSCRSGSSPGSRNGGGVWLSADASTAKLINASDRSRAYTPCARYGSSTSKRTVSPEWRSGRKRLCTAITSPSRSALDVVEPEHVPLDAEMAEHRGGGAEGERVRAAGRVRRRRADVGAHQLGWDQHRRATLDRLALECVVAVARPDANGAPQDLVIDPRPARRAALDLDVGMGGAELVEESIQRECLGVRAGRAVGTRSLDVVAVHVPLHERDVVVAQQGVEAFVARARTRRDGRGRARAGCGRAAVRSRRS